MNEFTIVNDVERRLFRLNLNGVIVAREVKLVWNRIDIVLAGKYLIGIEFKKNEMNWGTAIKQANHNIIAVDYSYVCIPEWCPITEAMINKAKENGIGILVYKRQGTPFKLILKAPKEFDIRGQLSRIVRNKCEEIALAKRKLIS